MVDINSWFWTAIFIIIIRIIFRVMLQSSYVVQMAENRAMEKVQFWLSLEFGPLCWSDCAKSKALWRHSNLSPFGKIFWIGCIFASEFSYSPLFDSFSYVTTADWKKRPKSFPKRSMMSIAWETHMLQLTNSCSLQWTVWDIASRYWLV
jgi:hypothetical protein